MELYNTKLKQRGLTLKNPHNDGNQTVEFGEDVKFTMIDQQSSDKDT
jgi:hypothetical protein